MEIQDLELTNLDSDRFDADVYFKQLFKSNQIKDIYQKNSEI